MLFTSFVSGFNVLADRCTRTPLFVLLTGSLLKQALLVKFKTLIIVIFMHALGFQETVNSEEINEKSGLASEGDWHLIESVLHVGEVVHLKNSLKIHYNCVFEHLEFCSDRVRFLDVQ